jgi:chromosome segregation ATPase
VFSRVTNCSTYIRQVSRVAYGLEYSLLLVPGAFLCGMQFTEKTLRQGCVYTMILVLGQEAVTLALSANDDPAHRVVCRVQESTWRMAEISRQLETQATRSGARIAELSASLDAATAGAAAARREQEAAHKKLQATVDKLEAEKSSLEKELAAKQAKVVDLRCTVASSLGAREKIDMELDGLRNEREALDRQLALATIEKTGLLEELAEMRGSVESEAARAAKSQEEMERVDKEAERLSMALAASRGQLEASKAGLADARSAQDAATSQVAKLEVRSISCC